MRAHLNAIAIAVSLGLLSCAHSQRPGASAPAADRPSAVEPTSGTRPKPELIAADAQRVTAGGVAYTAPQGWTSTASSAIVILTAQEGDAHLALVDATVQEPDAAVAEAWKKYRSAPPPPLKLAVEAPAREGWDQVRRYDYESSPNEMRLVLAVALRHGGAWSVILLDAAHATMEKRSAQFALAGESVRPAAYARESFKGKRANKLDAARLAKIDALIELGREAYGVPGVAIAIVQDGEVIAAKGYGVRELGKPAPVDANSLFMIASNTKALSTLLLAELVDDGKLKWEQPVTEVYPDFKLGSPATTASTRIEHLVCACTGLCKRQQRLLHPIRLRTAADGFRASPFGRLGTLKP
jgi:hypothetical protein